MGDGDEVTQYYDFIYSPGRFDPRTLVRIGRNNRPVVRSRRQIWSDIIEKNIRELFNPNISYDLSFNESVTYELTSLFPQHLEVRPSDHARGYGVRVTAMMRASVEKAPIHEMGEDDDVLEDSDSE